MLKGKRKTSDSAICEGQLWGASEALDHSQYRIAVIALREGSFLCGTSEASELTCLRISIELSDPHRREEPGAEGIEQTAIEWTASDMSGHGYQDAARRSSADRRCLDHLRLDDLNLPDL